MKRNIDIFLLVSILALTGFGILMVYSVQAAKGTNLYYLKRHLIWVSLGICLMIFGLKINIEKLKNFAYPLLILSIGLLLLVFIPGLGPKIKGAQRWLVIGSLRFQPSELAKIAIVVALAKFLADTDRAGWTFKRFLVPLTVVLFVQTLLILQPDFGGALMIGAIGLLMLFIGGAPLRYFIPIISLLVAVGTWLVIHAPYRLHRVLIFLDPWKDPKGEGFQLIQSLVALGRGGFTGVGIGNSQQKLQFLPEVRTDFIFAIVGEEIGLIGVFMVVSLFLIVLWRGYKIMLGCGGPFCRYLVFGLVMVLEVQAIINMAVVTGLLPTKGLPLPFISYGGSATVVNLATAGLLLGLSRGEPELIYSSRQKLLKNIARRRLKREGFL